MSYYAVHTGRKKGVYETWAECEKQVLGFKGAKYKKFANKEDAELFIKIKGDPYKKLDPKVEDNALLARKAILEPEEKSKEKEEVIDIHRDLDYKDLSEDEAIAYVDGSFDRNSKAYSYGVVFISNDGIEEFSKAFEEDKNSELWNIAGECSGAIFAVEEAIRRGKKKILICYDYMGIEYWALSKWKTNNTFTAGYRYQMKLLAQNIDISFLKVKGHSKVKFNEMADRLAYKAIRGRSKNSVE